MLNRNMIPGDVVQIGDDVTVKLESVSGGTANLVFNAPSTCKINHIKRAIVNSADRLASARKTMMKFAQGVGRD